ncbi:MAG: hypothetical protein JWN37_427 [Candidatus Nomurabacteria bacterium]|nr:hypothetical protein [Candidatus Nomurabacteria bacterium]
MKKLAFSRELKKIGVIGVDEVGRGPLAGPVTVCATYLMDPLLVKKDLFLDTVRDSKKINKALRNSIYQTIRNKRTNIYLVKYAIKSKSASYIDTHGISKAIRNCVKEVILDLKKQGVPVYSIKVNLDAGLKVAIEGVVEESYIKGDERYVEIALASIIAKEYRDSYMKRIAKEHSNYSWERNVGYGTKEHREAITKFGPCKHHRNSFLKAFK